MISPSDRPAPGTDEWREKVEEEAAERRQARGLLLAQVVEALDLVDAAGRGHVHVQVSHLPAETFLELRDVTFGGQAVRRTSMPYGVDGYRVRLDLGHQVIVDLHTTAPGPERASHAKEAVRPGRENQ